MTNEAGLEFEGMDTKRKEALDAIFVCGIDALRYLLNVAEDAPATQIRTILNSFYIDDNHTTKLSENLRELCAARGTIRAAIQSPRVPVIDGIEGVISEGRTWYGVAGNIDPVAVPMKDFDVLMRCARAYTELQKGV